jgi:hypothetical protein
VACGSEDGRILFWDLVSGKLAHTLEGEHEVSRSLSHSLSLARSLAHSLLALSRGGPLSHVCVQVRAIEEKLEMPIDTRGNRAFQHRLRPVVPSERDCDALLLCRRFRKTVALISNLVPRSSRSSRRSRGGEEEQKEAVNEVHAGRERVLFLNASVPERDALGRADRVGIRR